LYYNGSAKLATTSTGIDVTGTVTADGLTVDSTLATINSSGPNVDLVLTEGSTNTDARIRNSNGILEIDADLNNEFGNSSIMFAVDGTDKLKINNNGDISFYEDTGTTPKFFWDASAESLGIGTSSPSGLLEVATPSSGSTAVFNLLDNTADGFVVKQGTNEYVNVDTTNGAEVITLGNTTTIADVIIPAGNVGIGTSSIAAGTKLQVAGETRIYPDSGTGVLRFGSGGVEKGKLSVDTSSNMAFETGGSEAMRINSAGDWMVSNTVANVASNYTAQGGCGWVDSDNHFEIATTSNRSALEIGKNNANDGAIVTFRKQSLPVGSIGVVAGDIVVGSGSAGLRFLSTGPAIQPRNADGTANNDAIDIGLSGNRFKDLYLSGNINLSASSQINSSTAFYLDSDIIHFRRNNEAESARIDASGSLLHGTTSSSIYNATSGDGVNIKGQQGQIIIAKNATSTADPALWLNNTGVDGAIATFAKDGTSVGSIGVAGSRPYLANNVNFGIKLDDFGGGQLQPATTAGAVQDNACSLGGSSARWKDLYLSGGVYLGGTGSANKLDDYEEGTWTPTLYAATTGTNRVTAHTSSTYTKVGRLVRCKTYLNQIDGTALNGDTGAITLAGLPFTPTSFGHLYSIYNNLSDLGITAYASSTSIVLLRDDGHASLTPSNINTGTRQIMIDITFEVA
jgi:hypothetical protein